MQIVSFGYPCESQSALNTEILIPPDLAPLTLKKADRSKIDQQKIMHLCVALLVLQKPLLAS